MKTALRQRDEEISKLSKQMEMINFDIKDKNILHEKEKKKLEEQYKHEISDDCSSSLNNDSHVQLRRSKRRIKKPDRLNL